MKFNIPGFSKYYMNEKGLIYNRSHNRKINKNFKNVVSLENDNGTRVRIPLYKLQYDVFGIRFFLDDDELVYKVKGFPEILFTSKDRVFLLRAKRLIPKRKHDPKQAYTFRDKNGSIHTISINTLRKQSYVSDWENIK